MISSLPSELKTPLMSGLACCALNSQLRSILAFNASPTTLRTMAGLLSEMLAIVTDGVVVSSASQENQEQSTTILPVQLGSVETEEELWGSITLQQTDNGSSAMWQPGCLSVAQHQTIRIVIISDLTRLSLAATRACVMLMGASVAHLERHGQQAIWSPKLYWIVGCDPKRVGLVSPHLLDRFALRFHVDNSHTKTNRVGQLDTWLSSTENSAKKDYTLSSELQTYLKGLNTTSPCILPEAQQHILKYIALTNHYSPRRDLALLRLARTLAQLNGQNRVTSYQVDNAAHMLGLKLISLAETTKPNENTLLEDEEHERAIRETLNQFSSAMAASSTGPGDAAPQTTKISAIEPEASPNLPVSTLPPLNQEENPWLEDDTPIERDAESLRILPRHFSTATAGRGNIIGVEPATTPHDIAWVSTALEAAKFQALRQKLYKSALRQSNSFESTLLTNTQPTTVPLIIQTSDLRRYRREAIPEQLLTLVIDYTCLKGCNWQDSLEPYLQWAYVERAKVCLIRVGHGYALDQLRSERYLADKVQTPRIVENLTENVGRTTPLAHGLDLALQTIRHALQHGRKAVYHAILVVLSDGRGNVPLEASRVGHLSQGPVGKKGVEDALEIAKHLSALNKLESVVLNPQPKYYKNLPIQLAQALKGKIESIPPTKTWELSAEDWRVEV